jgi:hypothetical protein
MIPDEKKVRIILEGVRNVLLASLGYIIETGRRRSTSRLARTLKIYKNLPWGLSKSLLIKKDQNHLCRSQERPLSFLGRYDEDMEETEHFLTS